MNLIASVKDLTPQEMLKILSASPDPFLLDQSYALKSTHIGRYLGASQLPVTNVEVLTRKVIQTYTTQKRTFMTRKQRTGKALSGTTSSAEAKLQEVLGDRNSLASWLKKAKVKRKFTTSIFFSFSERVS
jgi:hypothetical protein